MQDKKHMKTFFVGFSLLMSSVSFAQKEIEQLATAFKKFEADSQFKHATISLYIVDSRTGKPVFDKNSQVGMAPASCLKVVTSTAAFELLGKDYRFKTELRYLGMIKDTSLIGNFYIVGFGDPTLGSWRYSNTGESDLMKRWIDVLKKKNIRSIGSFYIDDLRFSAQFIPGGWIWEDVANYYGAGVGALNWRENQFDLFLKAGDKPGEYVDIIDISPKQYARPFTTELKTGKKGSGDNTIIYFPANGDYTLIRGTIPAGEKNFKISGSMKDPSLFVVNEFRRQLDSAGITYKKIPESQLIKEDKLAGYPRPKTDTSHTYLLDRYFSPPLDSINYWFLQKSVNLYGEAFVKTIAYEKTGFGSTDTGVNIIKDFWSKNGIEKSALHMIDGSGLSPSNRVTTNALVTIMQYAKKQNWFPSFYNALPEQNGIKMKSGYIGGARSYTGYIKSKSGDEYSFAFIINNYDGDPVPVRVKMWKLLDILK